MPEHVAKLRRPLKRVPQSTASKVFVEIDIAIPEPPPVRDGEVHRRARLRDPYWDNRKCTLAILMDPRSNAGQKEVAS